MHFRHSLGVLLEPTYPLALQFLQTGGPSPLPLQMGQVTLVVRRVPPQVHECSFLPEPLQDLHLNLRLYRSPLQ